MKFGSVCSGIEAASVAWGPLGWKAAWFSEIEPFPCAVLAHHYPDVPNLGDMTTLPDRIASGEVEAPDLFCGGTPCQAFSVAGLRKSLDDSRGNLSLTFCEIANAIDHVRAARGEQPCIVFWENVPGVLSTTDNAFGCFLGALAGTNTAIVPGRLGWTDAGVVNGPQRSVAWRILDAQYFGVAQRRRRVFVVASAREGFDPTAVLFEFEGVRRDIAPSREAWQEAAGSSGTCASQPIGFHPTQDPIHSVNLCHAIGANDNATAAVAVRTANTGANGHGISAELAHTLDQVQGQAVAHVVGTDCYNGSITGDVAATMGTPGSSINASGPTVMVNMAVRRLTPVECERLQGFSDGYTNIPKKVVTDYGVGPCVKQVVTATVVAANGTHFVATNHCGTPQSDCPRAGMPTVEGYELCRSVCNQLGHAEVNAIKLAGKHASGATLYVEGHTYACEECLSAARKAGITEVIVGEEPFGTAADGPRYKALGNSWAVPVVNWIGKRIQIAVEESHASH